MKTKKTKACCSLASTLFCCLLCLLLHASTWFLKQEREGEKGERKKNYLWPVLLKLYMYVYYTATATATAAAVAFNVPKNDKKERARRKQKRNRQVRTRPRGEDEGGKGISWLCPDCPAGK